MPNPDKHVVQNPSKPCPKIQVVRNLHQFISAKQPKKIVSWLIVYKYLTLGGQSFLIMINRHTSLVGSLNIKQGENTDFAITCRVYCMAHTMGCKKLPGMTGSLVLYKGICRKVFSSID